MSEESLSRLHARVEGRVQGVGFRYFVHQRASRLRATGWVRNCWDGSVEVMAEGERATLDKLVSALWEGPRSSFVTDVKCKWGDGTGEFRGFGIKMTA